MTPARKLKEFKEKYSYTFKIMDRLLKAKKKGDWADWCLMHLSAIAMAISNKPTYKEAQEELLKNEEYRIAAMEGMALWQWSKTKGVYKFNKEVLDEVIATPFNKLPTETLMKMPEWCVYIDLNNAEWRQDEEGVFCYLQEDYGIGSDVLELTFLFKDGSIGNEHILLKYEALEKSVEASHQILKESTLEDVKRIEQFEDENPEWRIYTTKLLRNVVLLLAYICSTEADIVKVVSKKRNRIINGVPDFPTQWNVGERIGAAITHYKKRYVYEGEGRCGSRKRPHTRKAHWHHFWTGEGRTNLICKWVAPIPVGWNWDREDLPVVKHKVKL